MLDTLLFLLERLFLLAHINVSLPRLVHVEREPVACARRDNVSCSRFSRGDLLEVPRTLFTHFGIYMGDGRVAHLIPDALPLVTADPRHVQRMVTNTRLLLGVLSKSASVRVDSVEDFAYGAHILLNRGDAQCAPLRGEESALRAERLLGPVSYSLLWNNCEHFVTHCRYGHARSLQTEQFCSWLKSVVRDPRTLLASLLLAVLVLVVSGSSCSTVTPALLLPFTLWMAS
ncbi:lecithin retinol acyltransferase-like [Eucyclogobius newberryi]|uniref:lecithin retinol acyltransferase-like n=1 Tax=Eucyclogobius newberryi TaxID=166745 RepID=UPI003B5C487C